MTYHVARTHKEKAALAEKILNSSGKISVEVKRLGTRSSAQNASLHKWCELVAEELNAAGYDIQMVLGETFGLRWDKDQVKNNLWRPVQRAMMHKESTTQMNKLEPTDIHLHLNTFLSDKFGVSVPWPSVETMKDED